MGGGQGEAGDLQFPCDENFGALAPTTPSMSASEISLAQHKISSAIYSLSWSFRCTPGYKYSIKTLNEALNKAVIKTLTAEVRKLLRLYLTLPMHGIGDFQPNAHILPYED